MKKIGLLLSASPSSGGVFQYNLALLDAVISFSQDKFQVIFVYYKPLWESYLEKYPQEKIRIPLILDLLLRFQKIKRQQKPRKKRNTIIMKEQRIKNQRNMKIPLIIMKFGERLAEIIIAKYLYYQKCDLWIFPSHDKWCSLTKISSLCTIHDLMHRYERRFPEVSENGEYEKREKVFSLITKFSKGILVDSEIGKNQVIESYSVPKERIFVLPYIPPKYIYDTKQNPIFNKKYTLPKKYLFYSANFCVHKNHKLLIQAIVIVKRTITNIQLILLGSKKNGYKQVIIQIKKLGLQDNIHVIGYVSNEDIPELYRRSRGMIMPTFFVTSNIPPLEAFVLCCPIST